MKNSILQGLVKFFFSNRKTLSFLLFQYLSINFNIQGQDLVKNGNFNTNLNSWTSETVTCPTNPTNGWVFYTPSLIMGYPTLWEGSAFLKNKITPNQSSSIFLKQTINGLVPTAGNRIEISMDVLIGEANNLNMSNLPAEYIEDFLVLELRLGNVLYATVKTPPGWQSPLGFEFGKCLVNYYEGASSLNYPTGNSMKSISGAFMTGQPPYLFPVKNANWDISIPWECEKTDMADLEIRIIPNTYLNKPITDTRGQMYNQSCSVNNYSNLDDLAVDNISVKNKIMIDTPALAITNLTSTFCGQTTFDLTTATVPVDCPIAGINSLEYLYFEDADLTSPIYDPYNFETSQKEQTVYVVIANIVADPNMRQISSIKRVLKITRNELNTAGLVGSPYDLCSNTMPKELTNIVSPTSVAGASLSYFWERSMGDISGPYTAAAGNNTEINYTPSGLTTANESVTNYYFRRIAKSTLNGLTCQLSSNSVEITVKPCAPTSANNNIEYFDNPGGLNTVVIPNTLFSSTALIGQITNVKITKFPVKATSLTINSTAPSAKVAAAITYCGSPAAVGCVGSPFPSGGVILPTNLAGNPINTSIVMDPLDGSILVEIPYVSIDSRGFVSTEAKASVLFGNNSPLGVKLSKFEVKSIDNQEVVLNWETESEINFRHFEVETAVNNLKFEKKTELPANEKQEYETNLNNLDSGIWYFRLKIVDNDGSFEYSPIKSLVLKEVYSVLVKGNPSSEYIKLDLNFKNGDYFFNLYDNFGKNILANSKSINSAVSDFQLNKTPLPNGIYFLRINNQINEIIATKKIILN